MKERCKPGVKAAVKEEIWLLRNPLTVKQMGSEIIRATDAYIGMRLSERELRELLLHYAKAHGTKLFGMNREINPTICKMIGKKRKELLKILLSGFQISLL